jgi:queuine tRNA-ribosyltransferase
MSSAFRVTAKDPRSAARTGLLETPHGAVETPAFMPVGSQGTVKGLTHAQVESLGAEIMLVNSYHMFLRPGVETVEALGGSTSSSPGPGPS